MFLIFYKCRQSTRSASHQSCVIVKVLKFLCFYWNLTDTCLIIAFSLENTNTVCRATWELCTTRWAPITWLRLYLILCISPMPAPIRLAAPPEWIPISWMEDSQPNSLWFYIVFKVITHQWIHAVEPLYPLLSNSLPGIIFIYCFNGNTTTTLDKKKYCLYWEFDTLCRPRKIQTNVL